MEPKGPMTPLQRKMAASGNGASGGARSALRALRLGLARAADDVFDLAVTVIGATQARSGIDGLGRHLGEDRLLVLLDGPDRQIGVLSMDRDCLTALIQQQTIGKVTAAAAQDRPFTTTDAALTAPLIDAMIDKAAALTDLPADKLCLAGYRFGARAEDVRSLMLVLDAERFRLFDLTLEFSGGVRQGSLTLILPEPAARAAEDEARGKTRGPTLERAIGAVRADLTAVICRFRLPLSELAAMEPGDILPVMRERLSETSLVTITGQQIASGRLGQIGGLRAVRVNETTPQVETKGKPGEDGFEAPQVPQRRVLPTPKPVDRVHVQDAPKPAPSPEPEQAPPSAPELPDALDDETDDPFDNMTPEEAAAEISALAGLPPPGSEEALNATVK